LRHGLQSLNGTEPVRELRAPLATTLTNSGNLPLTITSIEITGANSTDFGQTNNCPSSLPPNVSCKISVTFTPLATGNRSAVVSVTDNAPGSPQSAPLTGVGTSPSVTLSPASLTFVPQVLGTTSPPQTVQVSASYAIDITSIETSAQFGQTNNCGKGLLPGGKCQIPLTLTPTTSGPQNGTLTINDSPADSPQTAPLSGTGQDFSVTPSVSSTQTVAPGQVANYTVAVDPLGGFNRTVTFSCSGAPAQSTCSISPTSVTLNGATSAPVAVTVTTAGASANLAHPSSFPAAGNRLALAFSGLPGLALLGWGASKRHGRLFYGAIFSCVLFALMTLSACGGGNGMGSSGSATPAGTYNLTVMGTFSSGSANLVHSTKLTLVVQ
jgi:trimeric autotransporter adhesin